MFKDFTRGLNMNRLALTIFAVFAFIFASDFFIHGVILHNAYRDSAALWRPESEMHNYMLWLLLGEFLIAKGLSITFAKGYEKKGLMEGFRFGVIVAPLLVAPCFIQYAVSPIPTSLMWAWVGLGIVQTIFAGMVAAMVYRR